MSTLVTTNLKHPSSGSNNIVLDASGGVDMDAFTVSGSAPADSVNLDASGRLLVGTSSSRSVLSGSSPGLLQVEVNGTTAWPATFMANRNDAFGPVLGLCKSRGTTSGSQTIVQSDDILGSIFFGGTDGSDEISGAGIKAEVDGTPGANDMPGRLVFLTTADGASIPTERMRITDGGNVMIGKTTGEGSQGTAGFEVSGSGFLLNVVSGDICQYVNRLANDGTLIQFSQNSSAEGSISVSGTSVSYNGAHLSRWSQLPGNAERTEILRGTVLSNIDEMCGWGDEDNEQLNRMKVSDVEGDKNVSGVFQSWDDDDDTYTDDFYCAMTGDFIIRIAQGVTVERGDLLMSAGDGTAKPQGDDIIRSKTVAKVTSTHVTCTYDDGSYCVPCVLMAC